MKLGMHRFSSIDEVKNDIGGQGDILYFHIMMKVGQNIAKLPKMVNLIWNRNILCPVVVWFPWKSLQIWLLRKLFLVVAVVARCLQVQLSLLRACR